MDQNSLRKIIENRIKTLEGNAFQDFCNRLFTKLHADYVPVRAGGNKGDLKNDGYCTEQRVFFQAHATINVEAAKIKKKIETDIAGCVAKQRDVKRWVFVTNQVLNGDIQKFVDDLRPKYPDVEIETWDHARIADEVLKLSKELVSEVLDINVDNQYSNFLGTEIEEAEVIDEIFKDVIGRIDEDAPDSKLEPGIPLEKKIKLNFTDVNEQEEVRDYFKYAFQKIDLIEKRMSSEGAETQRDLHSFMLSRYTKLKRGNLTPIATLHKLFEEVSSAVKNTNENLAKAFVLFFFDDCTIFEKL